MNRLKGMNWGPKRNGMSHECKYGIAYKGRPSWQRSFHSSQMLRVTPETGRRETGTSTLTREGEGRVMRKSCSMLKGMGTTTGEPVAVKAARRVRKGEVRKGLAEIPPEGCSGGSKRKTVPRWPPTLQLQRPGDLSSAPYIERRSPVPSAKWLKRVDHG
jgi:hypothetical protein